MSQSKRKVSKLAYDAVIFTDKNGTVLSKSSSPMHSELSMEYRSKAMAIEFYVRESGPGAGSYFVKVDYLGQTVLDVRDQIQGHFHETKNPQVETYTPGEWEKMIPRYNAWGKPE